VEAIVTAGAGFLLAVLWFDLMFDVQVLRHRGHSELPEPVLASIAGYYRRVTTDARPMNRLVAAAMLAMIAGIVGELTGDDTPAWVAIASLAAAVVAIGVAAARTVPKAVRLGARGDAAPVQSALARSIWREHLVCLALIGPLLLVQLIWA
jgi:hypothetical protein